MLISPPDHEILSNLTGLDMQTASKILRECGGAYGLARTPVTALEAMPGIGKKRARQVQAATQWALLLQRPDARNLPIIRTPSDVANLLMLEMSLLDQEELRVVVLNTKNHVLTIDTVYSGSINTTVIRVAEVFRAAVLHRAASIALCHNHPSGDPTPSPEDISVTTMIRDAGKLLDIDLLDHIIFAGNKFVSLKERGLVFK